MSYSKKLIKVGTNVEIGGRIFIRRMGGKVLQAIYQDEIATIVADDVILDIDADTKLYLVHQDFDGCSIDFWCVGDLNEEGKIYSLFKHSSCNIAPNTKFISVITYDRGGGVYIKYKVNKAFGVIFISHNKVCNVIPFNQYNCKNIWYDSNDCIFYGVGIEEGFEVYVAYNLEGECICTMPRPFKIWEGFNCYTQKSVYVDGNLAFKTDDIISSVREVKMPTINPFAKEQPLYIQVNTKNLKAYLYEYLKSTNTLREIVKLDVKSPDDRIVCENLWRNTFLCVQNVEGSYVSCCSVELTENQHVVKDIINARHGIEFYQSTCGFYVIARTSNGCMSVYTSDLKPLFVNADKVTFHATICADRMSGEYESFETDGDLLFIVVWKDDLPEKIAIYGSGRKRLEEYYLEFIRCGIRETDYLCKCQNSIFCITKEGKLVFLTSGSGIYTFDAYIDKGKVRPMYRIYHDNAEKILDENGRSMF